MVLKGLYIHIPFCKSKCCYCDFYSIKFNDSLADDYLLALTEKLKNIDDVFDTVYIGGGTPSYFGAERIAKLLDNIKFTKDAEITMECNPADASENLFNTIYKAGVNRLSMGLQSANDDELKFLTRRHSADEVKTAINLAKKVGFKNISLDVMLGLLNQTDKSLKETLDFCINQGVNHISTYMLHVEEGTPLAKTDTSRLPDDDLQSDLYLQTAKYLKSNGYNHYEISNFAKEGYQSRHNLIYWNCDDYLGLGPAAHSFWKGKRFHYDRDLSAFISGCEPIQDGSGGGFDEYLMLRLRLKDGFNFKEAKSRGFELNQKQIDKLKFYQKQGLALIDEQKVCLTTKGFLVQNIIVSSLI